MLSGRDIPVLSARKRCILRRKKKHTGRVQRSAKNDHPSSEIAGRKKGLNVHQIMGYCQVNKAGCKIN